MNHSRRRTPEKKTGPTIKLAAALLTIAALIIWFDFRGSRKPPKMQEFFTDDDGTTWFSDDGTKLAPFDHNGKMAVLAKVYQSKSGKQFVGYMMKFTPAAQKKIGDAELTPQMHGGPFEMKSSSSQAMLVKKPGERDWIPLNDPRAKEMKDITCPDGTRDYVIVRPDGY